MEVADLQKEIPAPPAPRGHARGGDGAMGSPAPFPPLSEQADAGSQGGERGLISSTGRTCGYNRIALQLLQFRAHGASGVD
jgi:hypothetical protein